MTNDLLITFIANDFAEFLTKYLQRRTSPPAGFGSRQPRHWMILWTMERDPDHWFSDHALTSWCSMIFMANEPQAGVVRFAFRRIFGAKLERPWC
jgi:hypothetical protein